MPLVPAICTQCKGHLNVDPSQEAAVCPHCKTPFITEKAINYYNTTNVTNIGSLHADVVQISDTHSVDNRVKSGETFIKLNEYDKAYGIFKTLIEDCPYDYRPWLGIIKVLSLNFTNTDISRAQLTKIENYYAKAKVVADPNGLNVMASLCDPYINNVDQKLKTLSANVSATIQRKVQENHNVIATYNAQVAEIEGKFKSSETAISVFDTVLIVLGIAATVLMFWFNGFWTGVLTLVAAFVVFCISSSITESMLEKKRRDMNIALTAKTQERTVHDGKFKLEMDELNNLYNKATQA